MSTKNEYRRDIELFAGWWAFGPYGRFVLGYKHDVNGVINNIRELLLNNDSGFQNDDNLQECKILLKKVRTAVLQDEGGINCNDKEKQESIELINSFIDEIEDLKAIWTEIPSAGNTANDGMVKEEIKKTGRPPKQRRHFKEYLKCAEGDKNKIIEILKENFEIKSVDGIIIAIKALERKDYFTFPKTNADLYNSIRLIIGQQICTDPNFNSRFKSNWDERQIGKIYNQLP